MYCLNCHENLKQIMTSKDQIIIIDETTIQRFVSCPCGHTNILTYGSPWVVDSYKTNED